MTTLAARYHVGYPTLREGFRKLEVLGLVSIQHGSGVCVRNSRTGLFLISPAASVGVPSRQVSLESLEARRIVELDTVAQAEERMAPKQSERLHQLIDEEHVRLVEVVRRHQKGLARTRMRIHLDGV